MVVVAEDAEGAQGGSDAAGEFGEEVQGVGGVVGPGGVVAGEQEQVEFEGGELVEEASESPAGLGPVETADVRVREVGDAEALESGRQAWQGEADGVEEALAEGHGAAGGRFWRGLG